MFGYKLDALPFVAITMVVLLGGIPRIGSVAPSSVPPPPPPSMILTLPIETVMHVKLDHQLDFRWPEQINPEASDGVVLSQAYRGSPYVPVCADNNWSEKEAEVICKQMDLGRTIHHYKANNPVQSERMMELSCAGTETHVSQCQYSFMSESCFEVAGVVCQGRAYGEDFIEAETIIFDGGARDLMSVDVDGDDDLDILGISAGPIFFENVGNGKFAAGKYLTDNTFPNIKALDYADMDGDGIKDLVVANNQYAIDWAKHIDGKGSFAPLEGLARTTFIDIIDIKVTDMNGDNFPDVLLFTNGDFNFNKVMLWMKHPGTLTRGVNTENSWTQSYISNLPILFDEIQPVDIDKDNDADFFVSSDGLYFRMYEQISPYSFVQRLAMDYVSSFVICDFAKDDYPDMVTISKFDGVQVAFNSDGSELKSGSPTQTFVTAVPLSNYGKTRVQCSDVDNDGDLDILFTAESYDRGVVNTWWIPYESGTFGALVEIDVFRSHTNPSFPVEMIAGDFTGDNFPEVVVGYFGEDIIIGMATNDGTGSFNAPNSSVPANIFLGKLTGNDEKYDYIGSSFSPSTWSLDLVSGATGATTTLDTSTEEYFGSLFRSFPVAAQEDDYLLMVFRGDAVIRSAEQYYNPPATVNSPPGDGGFGDGGGDGDGGDGPIGPIDLGDIGSGFIFGDGGGDGDGGVIFIGQTPTLQPSEVILYTPTKVVVASDIWGPSDLAVGDVNGDGLMDFVVASYVNGTVTAFLNDGGNAFTPLSVGSPDQTFVNLTFGVAVADLDGDNDADIIATSAAENSVYVFETVVQSGVVSFVRTIIPNVGDRPGSVSVADVNDDGRQDIIVATATSLVLIPQLLPTARRSLSALFGTADIVVLHEDGSNTWYRDVTLIDQDGDNDIDILVQGSTSVGQLKNLGNNKFEFSTAAQLVNTEAFPPIAIQLSVVDLDNNGAPDIVVEGTTVKLQTALTSGPGCIDDQHCLDHTCDLCLQCAPGYTVGSNGECFACPTIDFCTTLVCESLDYYCAECEPTHKPGSRGKVCDAIPFGTNTLITTGISAGNIFNDLFEVTDINNDGFPDLFATEAYFFGTGPFSFGPNVTMAPNTVMFANAGDVTDDGLDEILIGTNSNDGVVVVYNSDGNVDSSNDFGTATALSNIRDADFGDIDGDGINDFAWVERTNQFRVGWTKSNGDGTYATTLLWQNFGFSPDNIEIVDLNGDGWNDLIWTSTPNQAGVYYSLAVTQGQFINFDEAHDVFPYQGETLSCFDVGDFNNDGHPDFILGIYGTPSRLEWFKGSASGFEGPLEVSFDVGGVQYCEMVDMDADGDLDIFLVDLDTDHISWFENLNGDGNKTVVGGNIAFSRRQIINSQFEATNDLTTARVFDMDNDGDNDVVAKTYDGVLIYRNDAIDTINPTASCPTGTVVLNITTSAGFASATHGDLGVSGEDNVAIDDEEFLLGSCTGPPLNFPESTVEVPYTGPLSTHTVCYKVFDIRGNMDSCTFDVVVLDQHAPNIACPSLEIAFAGADASSLSIPSPKYQSAARTDNIGVTGYVFERADGQPANSPFPLGLTAGNLFVYDDAGNVSPNCTVEIVVFEVSLEAEEKFFLIPFIQADIPLLIPNPEDVTDSDGSFGLFTFSFVENGPTPPDGIQISRFGAVVNGIPTDLAQSVANTQVLMTYTKDSNVTKLIDWVSFDIGGAFSATGSTREATVGGELRLEAPVINGGFGNFFFEFGAASTMTGAQINNQTGEVVVLPTTSGTFRIVIEVTDLLSRASESLDEIKVIVYPSLQVSVANLPDVITTTTTLTISQTPTFTVSGGKLPVTYSLSGAPTGMTIDGSSGVVGGIAGTVGRSSYSVVATDANGGSVSIPKTVDVQDCISTTCGAGTCVDTTPYDGDYTCNCDDGTSSANCASAAAVGATNTNSSTDMAAIVGSSLGGLLVMAVLVAVFLYRRNHQDKRKKQRELQELQERVKARFKSFNQTGMDIESKFKSLELPKECLKITRNLGEGNFGVVDEAILSVDGGSTVTALKRLNKDSPEEEQEGFLFEARLMTMLDHENIVKVLGICSRDKPFWLVLEFLPGGDLRGYLKKCLPSLPNPKEVLECRELTVACRKITAGLVYLKSMKIIHRDLAARNVLVGNNIQTIKLADFGMSREVDEEKQYYRKVSNDRVPVKWMAPESIRDKVYTYDSDIWSFGVLVWEVFSFGANPYPKLTAVETVLAVATGHRLQRPKLCPTPIYETLRKVWAFKPEDRPNIDEVYSVIGATEKMLDGDNDDDGAPNAYVDLIDGPMEEGYLGVVADSEAPGSAYEEPVAITDLAACSTTSSPRKPVDAPYELADETQHAVLHASPKKADNPYTLASKVQNIQPGAPSHDYTLASDVQSVGQSFGAADATGPDYTLASSAQDAAKRADPEYTLASDASAALREPDYVLAAAGNDPNALAASAPEFGFGEFEPNRAGADRENPYVPEP